MRPLPVLLPTLALAAACVRTAPAGPAPRAAAPTPVTLAGAPAEPAAGEAAEAPMREAIAYLRTRTLVFPVAGVSPSRVRDTFTEARDGGQRTHNALDILAPRGTPVLAADDGFVLRLGTSRLGGIVVYATDPERRIVYYYAHLARRRDGLVVGARLTRGDTIGYVGTTGNAPANEPHLHFQVMRMPADPRAYWNGEPINPYPLLVAVPETAAPETAAPH